MIADAAIVAQKTQTTLHESYVWLYKHNVKRERLMQFVQAFGWDDIRDRIKEDRPLITLGEAGLSLKQSIHQSEETTRRTIESIPDVLSAFNKRR